MRTALQVLIAYFILLVFGVVWRVLPGTRIAPDVVAVFAVYLGLTRQATLAPAVLGAVIIGYLADLLGGSPHGVLALDAGIMALLASLVQRRLLVRGRLFTGVFTAIAGVVSCLLLVVIRAAVGIDIGPIGDELLVLVGSGLLTGLFGPILFRLCRRLDARFARTQRERMSALEGLIP